MFRYNCVVLKFVDPKPPSHKKNPFYATGYRPHRTYIIQFNLRPYRRRPFTTHPPLPHLVSLPGINCGSQCPAGRYGESCENECRCLNNSSCDPHTGQCRCSRGWTGADCAKPCAAGTFGLGCKQKCAASLDANSTCDHVTGQYVCRPGYIGLTCEHPCPPRTFGPGCGQKCQCQNGGECNHVTGLCQCVPGFTGARCDQQCPEGFFGMNCSQACKCQHAAKCRKNDGFCNCNAGYYKTHCDESEWITAVTVHVGHY